jgi:hypothetical protein
VFYCSFTTPAVTVTPFRQTTRQPPAITFTSNEFLDVTEFVDIPCAGESVVLQGQLHVLTHYTVTGNQVVSKTHFQPQGITGTGTVSGDRYHSTGVSQEIFKGSFSNGQYTTTMIDNFRIIGQGPGNNFLVHATFHLTLNANGATTATLDRFSVECK